MAPARARPAIPVSGMTSATDLRSLTSLRGIAAWWVVLYHIRLSIADLPPVAMAILSKGYVAVDFFFLLSGFVIGLRYADRLHDGGVAEIPGFLQRRVARIWPLHLVMLGAGLSLALVLAATGRHDPAAFPFGELPLHILLVQNWGLTRDLAWNDPAWSISAEFAAYLLFPLLVLAIDWRRVRTAAVIAAIVAALALLHLVMARSGVRTLGADITTLGTIRCMFESAGGVGLSVLWQRWQGRGGVGVGALSAGAAMMLGWISGAFPETIAVPVGFAMLLLAAAILSGRRGNPLDGAALHFLGEISYATYLGHFLLFRLFKLCFVAAPGPIPPLSLAAYLVLVLASSVLLNHFVERPAQRWISGWRPRQRLAVAGE